MPVRLREYRDFRAFLKAYYAHEKGRDPAFSYGVFARRAGLANRGHFKLVADGKRDLTEPMIRKYERGLGLGERDAEHFRLLVALNQARDPAARAAAEAAFRGRMAEGHYRTLPNETIMGFPNPFLLGIVYTMATLRGFRPDAGWIGRRLRRRYPRKEIRQALDYLFRGGHFRRRGRGVKRAGGLHFEGKAGVDLREMARWMLDPAVSESEYPAVFAVLPMAPGRIEALKEGQLKWLKANALWRGPRLPGEETHLILWQAIPLTRSPA